jgi:hypothetical protein
MKKCKVFVKPWELGLELHIEGVGVTQCYSNIDAEEAVRDYLRNEGIADPYHIEFIYLPSK